jgi:putative tryptophan/tyrosine transport system substrate-binding protein
VKAVVLAIGLVVVVATGPLTLNGQPQTVHRIGLLMATTPAAASHITSAFTEALREMGHVEGKNVILEYRWAEGKPERFPDLAADLVRLRIDVLVASSSAATEAARRVTSSVPIVMVNAGSPVETGLVVSLIKPGGNVTGLASQLTPEIRAKELQLLKEAVPRLSRVGIIRNAAVATGTVWKEYEAAGRALGLKIQFFDVRGSDGLAQTFARARRDGVQGLLVPGDPGFFTQRQRIVALATENRLPGIYATREFTDAGGFMSYSARLTDQFRRAAVYVDKILKGAKPADLPVEQPTNFELVINLKTAKALGLTFPQSLLQRADEIIQ